MSNLTKLRELFFSKFPFTSFALLLLISTSWYSIGRRIDLSEIFVQLLEKFEHFEGFNVL